MLGCASVALLLRGLLRDYRNRGVEPIWFLAKLGQTAESNPGRESVWEGACVL